MRFVHFYERLLFFIEAFASKKAQNGSFFLNYRRYFVQTFTNGHNFSFRIKKHFGVDAPRPTVSEIADFRPIFNALSERVKMKFRRF